MDLLLFIFIILFLTVSSGFFSASEAALFSLSPQKIKSYTTHKQDRYRLIADLVRYPQDLLVTIFMLNTLINILLQNTISHYVGTLAGWALTVGVPFALTLIFGEIIPKYIGLVNNISVSYFVVPIINFFQKILGPIRRLTIAITAPISRILFFFLKKEKNISIDELQHVLRTSKQEGIINPDEAELIDGYLSLQNMQIKEVMWPREEITFFDINDPLTKLTHLMVDQEFTRLPVCDKVIDNLLGVISARRYFMHRDELHESKDLVKFLHKPFFVPETIPARLLLRRFDEMNNEMALVVDEYGSISGLITDEDLIEEVIGDVTDLRGQEQLYIRSGKDVVIASGKWELWEFEEIFGEKLVSENNMTTIGGWLTEQLGAIPKSGTSYESKNFLFQILSAEPNRINKIYIRKLHSTRSKNG